MKLIIIIAALMGVCYAVDEAVEASTPAQTSSYNPTPNYPYPYAVPAYSPVPIVYSSAAPASYYPAYYSYYPVPAYYSAVRPSSPAPPIGSSVYYGNWQL